jgi:aspartate aminotransferase-like enzyme
MPGLLPDVDPDGLLEYSVVYSDRAVNHMSAEFQRAVNDIASSLKRVYGAAEVVIVPGSGTSGMEAVARQFATGKKCLVLRNGWFSYRWSQIFEAGSIPASETVIKARRQSDSEQAPFEPAPIEEVIATIASEKPDLVFAPHVETSAGMILSDEYLQAVADAAHAIGGMFVLDCIASGTVWVNMDALGIDVLVSAPQKGWSGSPCSGLVMLSPLAVERMKETTSSSFACDLKKWLQIMKAYENGGHAYHATMPTDALIKFRDVIQEMEAVGLDRLRDAQQQLGQRIREALTKRGFASVAAEGYQAPGVVVCYTDDPEIKNGAKFKQVGIQIAGGVPLMCDEGDNFQTFRIGLFGVDKLKQVDRTVQLFEEALDRLGLEIEAG